MSPPDKNDSGGSAAPAPAPSDRASGSRRIRRPAERESGFKNFDRTGMPEAKRLKDPSMRGRVKRSQENRARRKRRRRMQRFVLIPAAIALVFLVLIGMTLINYRTRDGGNRKDTGRGGDAAVADPGSESVLPAVTAPPAERPKPEPGGDLKSARDRFLLRTAPVDAESEISDESKEALRAAGLPVSEGQDEGEEISDEEKMRLLRKAAPYSRTVREEQRKRDISPDDLYIPQAKPAE